MTLALRYMRLADVPQVVTIDRVAFSTPWSARSYAYEVSESNYSYMVVLEHSQEQPLTGWKRLIRGFNGHNHHQRHTIISYGGLWHIMDEAHISTIATHPDWRGQGYGELVLAAMIQRAQMLNACYIVLEVRVSNLTAQNLYHKYGFEIVDTKRRYYRDNDEDAYDMRLNLEDPVIVAQFEALYREVKTRHVFTDDYTQTPRPRR